MCKRLLLLTCFILMLGLVGSTATFAGVIDIGIADDNDDVEERLDRANELDITSSDLELAYEDVGMGDPQVIGLRFVGVALPEDAVITAASVQFQVDEDKGGTDPVNVVIEGELAADAAPFVNEAFNVTSRARTAAQVLWSVPNWTNVGDRGPDQATPDLTAIIQEIVDQPDWANGNALVLIISDDPANPSTGVRCAEAGPGDDSAFLHIEFTSMMAGSPNPEDGAVDVKSTPVLTWTAPADTLKHELYFGTDADLVAAGDASVYQGELAQASFAIDVNQPLGRGITYYWKVDLTTGTARASEFHPGDVWSFRVADKNTESWLATAAKDAPGYIDTFVADGVYDIGTFGGEMTYEFVVISNPDETLPSMCLIGRRDIGDTQVGLKYEQWNNTGTYGATVFGVADYDYGVPTAPGEYTHLVFVSSETAGTTDLYVNGSLAGSVATAISLSGSVGIGYGAQDRPPADPFFDNFDGTIFGVAIYDGILSAEQIAAHSDAYFNPFEEIEPVNPGIDGLVAYYAFENDANDSSGNEINGTLVGDAKFAEGPAGYGMALDLDGDGDYVDCGFAPQLDITEQISFTYWMKAVALDKGWNTILSRGDDSWRSSRAGEDNFMEAAVGGTTGNYLYSVTPVDDGKWHHVGAVYDGSTFSIYVDGHLDASEESTGPITVSSYPLYIGNNSQNTDREWTGLIDEVMIYNRALSEAEILYVAGVRSTPVDPGAKSLLAWWSCDEGQGPTVGDTSGNGHDGTFVDGDPAWVEGIHGNAVQLVGPTVVEVQPLNLELTEATMAGWMKPNGPQPDWSAFIMTRDPGLATGFNVLGYQLAYHWNDMPESWSFRGGDMIAEDDWTFAAVTVAPDKARFYINGEAGSVNEISHGPDLWNSNVYLGGDGTANWVSRRMNGALDDVYLFDRALTTGEIRYLTGFRAMADPGTDNLVASYSFENDVTDGSGNGNDATVNGDPMFVEGVSGTALEFDGDGDFLDCGANPILALSDAVSISAWIKVAVMGADHKVGGNQDNANGGYKMSVYNDKVEFEIRTATNSAVLNRSVEGGTTIETDTWYHVVGVYSLEDGYIRTYVNGELDRELPTTQALGASQGPLMIGCEPFNTGSYNFNGVMDEVRVYNKALSEAEARYIANN